MTFLLACTLLAPQDAPYTAAELAALRASVDELVRAGNLVPAAAKFRELKPERIPPEELPKLQELDRKVGSFAALLLETSSGGVGEPPKLSRIVVKGGGKPLGRVFRQDALFVHYETLTGIRSKIAKAQVEAVTALPPAESLAELQKEFKNQAGRLGLVSTSEPGKPPAWKEVGKKATGAQLFAVADFAARNGLGEQLAPLLDLALQRDPKLRETAHVAKGERLVNQLLFSITVNQLPQAEHSLGALTARYRDTAAYRERVHRDKELGELVQVLLKKGLPEPTAPEEPKVLAAAPPPPPTPENPLAAAPPPAPVDVAPPAAPPPPPDPDPVDRTVPVTSRKLPPATAPDLLALVAKGDAMFDQAMKHLLASDPNENPDGWTKENAKALELFTKANLESYLPAQERFDAAVPQPLLDRVRETTLRSSLCRKRSVAK